MVILCARVIVLSTILVVSPLVAIVVSVVVGKIVPLGEPALFVSILSLRSTDGLTNFFNHKFTVVIGSPVPKIGNAYLVLADTSPILATLVACAYAGAVSGNILSHWSIASPAM
jgi:hypothetical protein